MENGEHGGNREECSTQFGRDLGRIFSTHSPSIRITLFIENILEEYIRRYWSIPSKMLFVCLYIPVAHDLGVQYTPTSVRLPLPLALRGVGG